MPSFLVTGASGSIGWAFLQKLSADPANTVIGMVRNKAATEKRYADSDPSGKNVHFVTGDIGDFESLKRSVDDVSNITGGSLDNLIANAAVMPVWSAFRKPSQVAEDPKRFEEELLECFKINTIGNTHLVNLYMPLILKGTVKRIIHISTGQADYDTTVELGMWNGAPYTLSKQAFTLMIAKFSAEYAEQGVLCFNLSPGVVQNGITLPEDQTENAMAMGAKFMAYEPSFQGPSTAESSVEQMMDVISKLSLANGDAAAFLSHKGNKRWI